MNKKPPKLNIPEKDKDQFKEVPFVHDMTDYQLKVMIKRMWINFQELANTLQEKRPDVSTVIDKVLSKHNWNEKDIQDRYVFINYKGIVMQYDTKNKTMILLDDTLEPMGDPVQGFTMSEMKAKRKAQRETA